LNLREFILSYLFDIIYKVFIYIIIDIFSFSSKN